MKITEQYLAALDSVVNESKHAISDNPGYGYNGTVDLKVHKSKKTAAKEKSSDDEAERAKHYKKMHQTVRSVTGADAQTAKHYLDSKHGRHLADVHNDNTQRGLAVSNVHNYIKKDFDKFKKHYKKDFFGEGYTGDIDVEQVVQEEPEQIEEATYTSHNFDKHNDHPTRSGSTFIKGVHGNEHDHVDAVRQATAAGGGKAISKEHAKKIVHHPDYHEHAYKYRHDFSRGGSNGYDNGVKKLAGVHAHHPDKVGAIKESKVELIKRIVKEETKSADKKPVITTNPDGKKVVRMVTRKHDLADAGGKDPHDESTNTK